AVFFPSPTRTGEQESLPYPPFGKGREQDVAALMLTPFPKGGRAKRGGIRSSYPFWKFAVRCVLSLSHKGRGEQESLPYPPFGKGREPRRGEPEAALDLSNGCVGGFDQCIGE